jgi:hypothetical protein
VLVTAEAYPPGFHRFRWAAKAHGYRHECPRHIKPWNFFHHVVSIPVEVD